MAPDLNGIGKGGQWDYSQPGSSGYNVPFHVLNDPTNRHIRIIAMGAGVSGIMIAYQLQKHTSNFSLKIFEKNNDIGGTWKENKYPNAACDIPSHAYTYSFATNPDWPYFFSYSNDIESYLNNVCETFGLRQYMTFSTRIVGCYWQEKEGEWLVKLRREDTGEEYEERCDLLLQTTGLLNSYKYPDLPGMDKFKGKIVHTAAWPNDYNAEEWKKESVAVIGSGASSIQTVPGMQPHVKHMDVFIRTGVWFVAIANNQGSNKAYSEEEKAQFKKDPEALARHGNSIESQVNGLWGSFYSDMALQGELQTSLKQRMSEYIKDERLLQGFTPEFGVGCRRITPGDPYMLAIQEPNVDVHFTAVKAITEEGLLGEDDVERKCDTIVCATGFDTTFKPRFDVVGRNGVSLADKWKDYPTAYLGLAVPDIPNYFIFLGPPFPVENGSVMASLLSLGEYVVQTVKKMQFEDIRCLSPKQSATDSFDEHTQEWLKHTVWVENCRSWYRDNETGRVNAVWPGSSLHFQHVIARPRWEDYEIEYNNKRNMWAFMGIGWSIEDRDKPELMERANRGEISYLNELTAMMADPEVAKKMPDIAPYLHQRFIDPQWLVKAFGWSEQEAEDYAVKTAEQEAGRKRRAEIRREKQKLPAGRYGWSETQTGLEHRI